MVGGDFVVKFDDKGSLKSVSKSLKTSERPSTTPRLGADQALVEAGAYFNGAIGKLESKGLVVYATGKKPTLAHEVNVNGWQKEGFADKRVYVDASPAPSSATTRSARPSPPPAPARPCCRATCR